MEVFVVPVSNGTCVEVHLNAYDLGALDALSIKLGVPGDLTFAVRYSMLLALGASPEQAKGLATRAAAPRPVVLEIDPFVPEEQSLAPTLARKSLSAPAKPVCGAKGGEQ